MSFRHKAIIDIFTKLGKKQFEIWLSGKEGEGEAKVWHKNGQISVHVFFKNGKLDGEAKWWHYDRQILEHSFYRNDKKIKMPKNIKKGYIYADGKYWKD